MAISDLLSVNEVFTYLGVDQKNRDSAPVTAKINALIVSEFALLESYLGRRLLSTTLTNFYIRENIDFHFVQQTVYFDGFLTDMYELTSIIVDGEPLVEKSATNYLNYDYEFNPYEGSIFINRYYSNFRDRMIITGKYGFVDRETESLQEAVKQVIIEMIECKSNLTSSHTPHSYQYQPKKKYYSDFVMEYIRRHKRRSQF